MKNIHNLLTDAFDAAYLKEQDFNIRIEDTYSITITKPMTIGTLYMAFEMDHDSLRNVHFVDTLLTDDQYILFSEVIKRQVSPSRPPNQNNPGNLHIDTSFGIPFAW